MYLCLIYTISYYIQLYYTHFLFYLDGKVDACTQVEQIIKTDVETSTEPHQLHFPPVYGTGETMCDMLLDLKDLRYLKCQKIELAKQLNSGTQIILPDKSIATKQKGNL